MNRLALLLAASCAACAHTVTPTPQVPDVTRRLTFIEDDYPLALAQAQERSVPLFIEAWAPWCHSCVFMKEHVFNRSDLAAFDDRFVFLALDTEKESAAPVLAKYPVENWPTFFFVDSKSGAVLQKWVGTADVTQLKQLFTDVRAQPLTTLAEWYQARKYDACAASAQTLASGPTLGFTEATAAGWGVTCALRLPVGSPARTQALSTLEPVLQKAKSLSTLLADDRSGFYELLFELRESEGDAKGAQLLAAEWLSFLEESAQAAESPAARAVYDAHRVSAALGCKQPERVVLALLASERDLPRDYNAPARLSVVYRELKQYEEALAANARALKLVYGPRTIRVLETLASIHDKRGDVDGQKAALQKALLAARALPAPQANAKTVARLEAALSKLNARP